MFFSSLFFLGKKTITPGPTPEEAVESFEGLSCKKVKVLGSFQLSKDDPANYPDKLTFLEQRRDLSGSYPRELMLMKTGVSLSRKVRLTQDLMSLLLLLPVSPQCLQLILQLSSLSRT